MLFLSRRSALLAALIRPKWATKPAPSLAQKIVILTRAFEIRLLIEYFDRYVSHHFKFNDSAAKQAFCLGADGTRDTNCLAGFAGSLAVVNFRVLPRGTSEGGAIRVREHVRMIDRHDRLPEREPYERVIELPGGLGSDIQAFGYEAKSSAEATEDDHDDTWCLFRQDLYLGDPAQRFTTLHWKHTLARIRLLDLIPSGDAQLLS